MLLINQDHLDFLYISKLWIFFHIQMNRGQTKGLKSETDTLEKLPGLVPLAGPSSHLVYIQ